MLRPRPAHWFEVMCPRGDGPRLVRALAATGAIEIEMRASHHGELRLQELSEGLAAYRAMLPRYARYWQRAATRRSYHHAAPRQLMQQALDGIAQWRANADPVITQLQAAEDEHYRLRRCAEVLQALGESDLDFTRLNAIGPLLGYTAALLPATARLAPDSESSVILSLALARETYLLAVAPRAELAHLDGRIKAVGGRLLQPPAWLQGKPPAAKQQIEQRLRQLEQDIQGYDALLAQWHEQFDLPIILGELNDLEWFVRHVGVLELASDSFALVTGWTDERDGTALLAALEAESIPALPRFPSAPPGLEAPRLFDNPRWAKPFEVFARAFGVPGGNEADPSPLLALVAPLLFGYMFGDVGQGLLLLSIGWWLRRRWRLAWLLICGGASAMLFGVLFGSVFGMENHLPALWLRPLQEPLSILGAPLLFAVALLATGQCLDALQASWRRQLRSWLLRDGGFLLLYLGLAGYLFGWAPPSLAALGLAWYLLGTAVSGGLWHALGAAAELLERGLQLGVNTLSFARVGAFALAHAGLCSAMISLAEASAAPPIASLILVVGHLLIIALEGLVVSIQTTRLILFEFFNRFLRGEGRVFRPLPPPPGIVQGES